ncbi:hypothetical protein C8R44DRAFT_795929 [Mycena epipterygia]|nr:hypothetical protein C8R44DRAFT_795929 [Mycena epipterygia]
MFVPFVSDPRRSSLSRRKGGGKSGSSSAGKGSSSSTGKSGSSTTSNTGKTSSSTKGGSSAASSKGPSGIISSGGVSRSITRYGFGGGKIVTIPSGQLFAGRTEGGATRNQIWGTRVYGSGYPGMSTRGVNGRGFPFFFWPLVWATGLHYAASAGYLHTDEYGQPNNSSRPGGPMASAVFQSNSTPGTTFRLVADNMTVTALITDIAANCSSFLVPESLNITAAALNVSAADAQKPEEVVQYYRASSVALSLDGYNNTAIFAADSNSTTTTADTPLPVGIDVKLLDCLNNTIGLAVPLVNGAQETATVHLKPLISVPFVVVVVLALMICSCSS